MDAILFAASHIQLGEGAGAVTTDRVARSAGVSIVITRATEALVFGMSRDEPPWLAHPAFVDEVTELVVGYLARRG